MAETFLELWLVARERDAPEAPALERLARRFCEAMERGARACAVAHQRLAELGGVDREWHRSESRRLMTGLDDTSPEAEVPVESPP